MARPKLGEGDTQRLQLKISDEELMSIEDWRFSNRVTSRSEAVRRLVRLGIEADSSLDQIRIAAESVYEDLARRIGQWLEEVKQIKDTDSMMKYHAGVLSSFADILTAIGELGSAIREMSDKATAMKTADDMASLIAKAKQIAADYEQTRARLKRLRSDRDAAK